MAYGNGAGKDMEKRMVDLGQAPMSHELSELRRKCLDTMREMVAEVFPADIITPVPDGKRLDGALLRVQKAAVAGGLSSVWAEKCRLMTKGAVLEQWKRGQRNLFGRFHHIATRGERPAKDGHRRLVNLPEDVSRLLTDADVAALQSRAETCDFRSVMELFVDLREGDAGFTPLQADALRALHAAVQQRWGPPEYRDDAVIQLHLDERCIRGGKTALSGALGEVSSGLGSRSEAACTLRLTSHVARGDGIPLRPRLSEVVAERMGEAQVGDNGQRLKAFAVELGPDKVRCRGVVVRPRRAPSPVGCRTVVANDFGFVNTASLVVARSAEPIDQARLDFAQSDPGKKQVKAYLEGHVSGDDVEILERVQLSGRNFLARIREQAARVDRLRSEIDRCYGRLYRIRAEINRIVGQDAEAVVPEVPDAITSSNAEQARYVAMHRRFFRLLGGIGKLKERRRAVYRAVAGLKAAWFGHVANIKARLAETHGAVAVREDLSILAVPTDDPAYKGRTFNKMINNGSKGQYTRGSPRCRCRCSDERSEPVA